MLLINGRCENKLLSLRRCSLFDLILLVFLLVLPVLELPDPVEDETPDEQYEDFPAALPPLLFLELVLFGVRIVQIIHAVGKGHGVNQGLADQSCSHDFANSAHPVTIPGVNSCESAENIDSLIAFDVELHVLRGALSCEWSHESQVHGASAGRRIACVLQAVSESFPILTIGIEGVLRVLGLVRLRDDLIE